VRSRDLPISRSYRWATPADTTFEDRGDCVVWRAPRCPESWFGHRLELDHPGDPVIGFARWDAEQTGIEVDRRFLTWETPLDVPFPPIAPRYAPSYAIGLERPPGPISPVSQVLPIRAAGPDLPSAIEAAARQHPQFGPTYRAYVRWLYEGLAERGATTFVAWDADRVVAAATIVPGPGEIGRFQEVWTQPAWRRQGLAMALLAAAIRQHVDRSLLVLCDQDSDAHRIYARAGFRPVSRWVELSSSRV
jgi:GNAT superfamily N-acetyltransferase